METFEADFAPRLAHRAPTWRAVVSACLARRQPLSIVETGCLREPDNWVGDGQSTVILAWLAKRAGGQCWSVDMSEAAVSAAKRVVGDGAYIRCSDSVKALSEFVGVIDLLYLDSLDFDGNNPLISAQHHLFELCASGHALRPGSIVMVDDTQTMAGKPFGKGMLIAPYMDRIGAETIATGETQIAWRIPGSI